MSRRPIQLVSIPMQVASGHLRSIEPQTPGRARRREQGAPLLHLRVDVAGKSQLAFTLPASGNQVPAAIGDLLEIAYIDYPGHRKIYGLRNRTRQTVHLAAAAKPVTPFAALCMALLLVGLGGVGAYAMTAANGRGEAVIVPMAALLFALNLLVIWLGYDSYVPGTPQPGGRHHLKAACKALALSRKEMRSVRMSRAGASV
ncbi:hypothetical protein [Bordetella genomosp. 4]|nr:hypothetical protein [Bordetella genomosp. 4]